MAPEKSCSIFKLNSIKIVCDFEGDTFPSSETAVINGGV